MEGASKAKVLLHTTLICSPILLRLLTSTYCCLLSITSAGYLLLLLTNTYYYLHFCTSIYCYILLLVVQFNPTYFLLILTND